MNLRKLYLNTIGIDYIPQPDSGTGELAVSPANVLADGRTLEELRAEIGDCTRCSLHESRSNIVFGVGNPNADLVFVGEAPGRDEDAQGEPFVGKAGQLLTKIIGAMGLDRDQVYICNVLKCRPPGNRDPLPDEVDTCRPFLDEQLRIIGPKVICALGSHAARTLMGEDIRITRVRGIFHDLNGTPLMPTFHPSYLLRNESAKREVWEDIQKVMKELDLPVSGGDDR
jgi:DNA polymerase